LFLADHRPPKNDLLAGGPTQDVAGVHAELVVAARPRSRPGLSHQALDELKRSIALAVVRQFTPNQIRAQILANLHRWRHQDAWVSAYDEWLDIAERADDGELFAAMLGRDDGATRLRQSMPVVGLLSQEEVRRLHEEAAG
jgi:hypothetical protein